MLKSKCFEHLHDFVILSIEFRQRIAQWTREREKKNRSTVGNEQRLYINRLGRPTNQIKNRINKGRQIAMYRSTLVQTNADTSTATLNLKRPKHDQERR